MSKPEICLHCGGVEMHYEDCAWPTMGQSLEPEREAQERIAELEKALAEANARAEALDIAVKALRMAREHMVHAAERRQIEEALAALAAKAPRQRAGRASMSQPSWIGLLSDENLREFQSELESHPELAEMLDAWEATAELDAAPEVAAHLLKPRSAKDYVTWSPGSEQKGG